MAAINRASALVATLLLVQAAALRAQTPPPAGASGPPPAGAAAPGVPKKPIGEPKLVFDREVFNYGGAGRRDPFKPLLGKESLGPLFEDLKLKGVIYSRDQRLSIVLVQDGAKRLYRLHRGDVVGNSRVVDIQPLYVRFAVENFGMIRNEVLELKRGAADAAGVPAQSSGPVPAQEPIANRAQNAADAKRMLDSIAKERAKQSAQTNRNEDSSRQQEDRR